MKTTKCTYEAIQAIIDRHDKYRKSYFWTLDNGNAATRARNAFDFEYQFRRNGHVYYVYQEMHQSRKNTYYHMAVTVDGNHKDVRALKKLRDSLPKPKQWTRPVGAVYENSNLVHVAS